VKRKMIKRVFMLFIVLLLSSYAYAEDGKYSNSSFARLSYISGKVYIQRAADLSYEEGMINMPIAEGDRLWTTDGRIELYVARGKYIRLDHNTKIDIIKLPDKNRPLIQIRLCTGNCYLRINFLENEKEVHFLSKDVSLYFLDKGLYRIDVRNNQETETFVFKGLLEAALEKGSELVKDKQRLEVIDGFPTSRPSRFMSTTEDSFDRWNIQRDEALKRHLQQLLLPQQHIQTFPAKSNPYERRIPINRIYPSSPKIHSTNRRKGRITKYSSSTMGRLYNSISGGKSSYIRSRSSQSSYRNTSSKRIILSSRSGSTKPPVMRAPSSKSSSRTKKK